MKIFCDIILMTYFRWHHLLTSLNDVITDILEFLLRHNQFARPQIGQITQLRINKMQKIKTIRYFYKNIFSRK